MKNFIYLAIAISVSTTSCSETSNNCCKDTSLLKKYFPLTLQLNNRLCAILRCCITLQDAPDIPKDESLTLPEEDRVWQLRALCCPCSVAATTTMIGIYAIGCAGATTTDLLMLPCNCFITAEPKKQTYQLVPQ